MRSSHLLSLTCPPKQVHNTFKAEAGSVSEIRLADGTRLTVFHEDSMGKKCNRTDRKPKTHLTLCLAYCKGSTKCELFSVFYFWQVQCRHCFLGVFLFCFFVLLYSRFLLVVYFIHISVYMSIPISQFIPPALLLSPLGVHTFVLYICVSISALQTSSSVPFF